MHDREKNEKLNKTHFQGAYMRHNLKAVINTYPPSVYFNQATKVACHRSITKSYFKCQLKTTKLGNNKFL